MTPVRLRAATRGSPLARWQTDHVARLLAESPPEAADSDAQDANPQDADAQDADAQDADARDADARGGSTPAAGGGAARVQPGRVAGSGTSGRPALPEVPLSARLVNVVPVVVSTTGDRRAATPIHEMGGKGVFAKEVQAAVLDGRADIAVHSAKDLPSITPPGLVLAAVPRRGDPRDALVGGRLAELPKGASVATGSVRRRAQLASLRPDLCFAELRGNIATRLRRARGFDAIMMAAVALDRLGITPDVLDVLPAGVMIPQAGQGAIAVECRADDHATLRLLSRIEHRGSRCAVDAERAFLAELGGDCTLPAGAHATATAPAPAAPGTVGESVSSNKPSVTNKSSVTNKPSAKNKSSVENKPSAGGRAVISDSRLSGGREPTGTGMIGARGAPASSDDAALRVELTGLLASVDGRIVLREIQSGNDPVALGRAVARRLLHSADGRRLISELR